MEGLGADCWAGAGRGNIALLGQSDVYGISWVIAKVPSVYRSTTGVVNIYDSNSITQGLDEGSQRANEMLSDYAPKPIRELMNHTTAITSVSFNHDAQVMAIASSKKKDAFRVVSWNSVSNEDLVLNWYHVDPPAIRYNLQQLANQLHPSRSRHMYRLFSTERIYRHRQYKRESSAVRSRALWSMISLHI